MVIQVRTHGKTPKDYLYCADCKTWFDFWKYDYDLKAAGHDQCKHLRHPTPTEFVELLRECGENGCFEENIL